MEDKLICAICFEKFTYPCVLDCGHTFDKQCMILLNKYKCPICNEYSNNINRINWIIVELLNLKLEITNTEIKPEKTIQDSVDLYNSMIKDKTDEIIETVIIDKIMKNYGKEKIEIGSYDHLDIKIIAKLNTMGYNASIVNNKITIYF